MTIGFSLARSEETNQRRNYGCPSSRFRTPPVHFPFSFEQEALASETGQANRQSGLNMNYSIIFTKISFYQKLKFCYK